MATIFLSGRAPRVLYRVMMKQADKWKVWTNYAKADEAELAAPASVTGGKSSDCEIVQIDKK